MKRIIFLAIVLLLLLTEPIQAVEVHQVFLPMVSTPRIAVIDCADADGRLMECP